MQVVSSQAAGFKLVQETSIVTLMMPLLLLMLIIRRDHKDHTASIYSFQPSFKSEEDVFISAHLTERVKRTPLMSVSVVFTSCRIFTLRLFRSQPFYWPLGHHVCLLWPLFDWHILPEDILKMSKLSGTMQGQGLRSIRKYFLVVGKYLENVVKYFEGWG